MCVAVAMTWFHNRRTPGASLTNNLLLLAVSCGACKRHEARWMAVLCGPSGKLFQGVNRCLRRAFQSQDSGTADACLTGISLWLAMSRDQLEGLMRHQWSGEKSRVQSHSVSLFDLNVLT